MADEVWLFSYGTLQQSGVQRALFGREVKSIREVLFGFEIGTVTITDRSVIQKSGSDRHPILIRSSETATVQGSALCLIEQELRAADSYEAEDYLRVPVVLASGRKAFAYVSRDGEAPPRS